MSVKELCENHPEEFAVYMNYVRNLKFEEQPDYDYLRGLMNKVMLRLSETDDLVFDWMPVMDQHRKERDRQRELESKNNTATDRSQKNEDGMYLNLVLVFFFNRVIKSRFVIFIRSTKGDANN